MTDDQIRDRLAELAGYGTNDRGDWYDNRDGGHLFVGTNPIPPLDSPCCLGTVMRMLPEGWRWDMIGQRGNWRPSWYALPVKGKNALDIQASTNGQGQADDIEHAVALAVIAAHEQEKSRGE